MPAPTPTGPTRSSGSTRQAHPKPANIRRRQYAGEEDWRRHREKISALYRTNRLKDVMAIMETEHGLYATERMYKARFKDWNLQKNVTAAEVHKLMQKVEQEQQRQCRTSPPGENGRVVLDVGDDLDVKRIQKYMKRRPKGLDKLRKDPHRPLEVIKALSVDAGRAHGTVSIATVKLEERGQVHNGLLTSPPSNLALPWSPGPEVPGDISRLLRTFIDTGFDAAYAVPCSPATSFTSPISMSPEWHFHVPGHSQSVGSVTSSFESVSSQDETMLEFVLKLQAAQILLGQGFIQQGFDGINMCLDTLALYLQQRYEMPGLGNRPATVVVLWALLAALETAVCFKHIKNSVLPLLYQRLVASCAAHQPTMAEMVGQLARLGGPEQEATITQARQMISHALFADPACYSPAFETYSRTLDVAVSALPATSKVQTMCDLASKPILPGSSTLDAWVELRTALVMSEVLPSVQPDLYQLSSPLGPYGTAISPSWNAHENKLAAGLEYVAGRIASHKAVGNWQVAQEMASQAASVAEMAWGRDGEMARRFRIEADALRSPGQIPCSMGAMEPGFMQLDFSFGDMSFSPESTGSLGWQQKAGQGLARYPSFPIVLDNRYDPFGPAYDPNY